MFVSVSFFIYVCVMLATLTHAHSAVYSPQTGSLYRFHQECRTFEKARRQCRDEGGNLAVVNSAAEAAVLGRLFQRNQKLRCESEIYLGVHYEIEEGDFRTLDGKSLEEAGYARWADGEPNNVTTRSGEGEQCVTLYRNLQLNDLHCSMRRPFVCEVAGYSYKRQTDGLFEFYESSATSSEAAQMCKAQGGQLAAVITIEEAESIRDVIPDLYTNVYNHVAGKPLALVGYHYDFMNGQSSNDVYGVPATDFISLDIFANEELGTATASACAAVDVQGRVVKVGCDDRFAFICERNQRLPSRPLEAMERNVFPRNQ